MRLGPRAALSGTRALAFDTVRSTNDEAFHLAAAGDPGRVWITAVEQSLGRGRHGRPWVSVPGNLYASLLLVDAAEPRLSPQLGLVAALAVHDAVLAATACEPGRLEIKWPNDLLLDGAKVAGILVEARSTGRACALVIGVGVNAAQHPGGTPYGATDLDARGLAATPGELFAHLSDAFVARLNEWDRGAGFPAIRSAWLARSGSLGRPVEFEAGGTRRTGLLDGLDPHGRLLVATDEGRLVVEAGEIRLLNPSATSQQERDSRLAHQGVP